jgi:hypothetical protein
MRICNFGDGLSQLSRAMLDLDRRSQEAAEHWTDTTSREFADEHLRPIGPRMQALITAAQALATSIEKATRELDDPRNEA